MIDLSKAYAGQIATLRNNVKLEIKAIYRQEYGVNVNYHIHSSCGNYDLACFVDGKDCDNETEWDIMELSEPKRIQSARLEGELKGIELALNCAPLNEWSKVYAQRTILIEQLKILHDEGNN